MRTCQIWAAIGLLLIAAGIVSAASAAAGPSPEASLVTDSAPDNLVPNPSFETPEGPLPLAQGTAP
jgi:hypothetical protein